MLNRNNLFAQKHLRCIPNSDSWSTTR